MESLGYLSRDNFLLLVHCFEKWRSVLLHKAEPVQAGSVCRHPVNHPDQDPLRQLGRSCQPQAAAQRFQASVGLEPDHPVFGHFKDSAARPQSVEVNSRLKITCYDILSRGYL